MLEMATARDCKMCGLHNASVRSRVVVVVVVVVVAVVIFHY